MNSEDSGETEQKYTLAGTFSVFPMQNLDLEGLGPRNGQECTTERSQNTAIYFFA